MSAENLARRASKRILIYPGLQLRMLFVNLALMIGVGIAVAFFVHRSFVDLVAQGVAANLPPQNAYFTFMAYQEKLVMAYLATGIAVASLLSSLAILVFSHRMAGPIVRMRGFLDRVAEANDNEAGDPPLLEFRKGDYFDDLPAKVNAALKTCAKSRQSAGTGGSHSGVA